MMVCQDRGTPNCNNQLYIRRMAELASTFGYLFGVTSAFYY